MKKKLLLLVFAVSVLLLFASCSSSYKSDSSGLKPLDRPHADREFRGVWVATVSNIDWPSKPGLTVEEQQKEARIILDSVAALHMNAVVFQVRPHCDAMYASSLEPWSSYLTGTQGKAPEPFYDPLQFWVEEAHNRGLELHAWFNPYRALLPRGGEASEQSLVKRRPDLAKKLRDGTYWLDPSKQDVQDHSYAVVMDVVKRYDVDGIHFDDYFYPYGDGSFPDSDSWDAYKKNGGSLLREDWRRDAVNIFIHRVYEGIKKEKKYVKFGLSPFGIWRPGYPASISGFDQYNGLYADAKLWLNNGWVDYWTPQLYWPVNQIPQSFPVLLGWWNRENIQGRNLWPGMIVGRSSNEKGTDEIINQIMIERGFVPEAPGHVHFSMKAFLRDSSVLNAGLKNGPYKREAIVPPSPWLDDVAPAAPGLQTEVGKDTIRISWSHDNRSDVFRYVVYYNYGKAWEYTLRNRNDNATAIPLTRILREQPRARQRDAVVKETTENLARIAVTAVDRVGNESEPIFFTIGGQMSEGSK